MVEKNPLHCGEQCVIVWYKVFRFRVSIVSEMYVRLFEEVRVVFGQFKEQQSAFNNELITSEMSLELQRMHTRSVNMLTQIINHNKILTQERDMYKQAMKENEKKIAECMDTAPPKLEPTPTMLGLRDGSQPQIRRKIRSNLGQLILDKERENIRTRVTNLSGRGSNTYGRTFQHKFLLERHALSKQHAILKAGNVIQGNTIADF